MKIHSMEQQENPFQKQFESVYIEHRDSIYGFICSLTGDRDLAQDITQTTFLKFWSVFQKNHGTEYQIPYLFKIARNETYRLMNRNAKLKIDPLNFGLEVSSEPNPPSQEHEKIHALIQEVHLLPLPLREVFVLKAIKGLTFKAISEAVDLPLKNVASKYRRALKVLKKKLSKKSI